MIIIVFIFMTQRSLSRAAASAVPSKVVFALLHFDIVRLVPVAVKARQADILLLRTPAFGDWNDMVELDLRIVEMLLAVLASVVVSSDDPHLDRKRYIPSPPSGLACFGHRLARKYHRADVPEMRALHFG